MRKLGLISLTALLWAGTSVAADQPTKSSTAAKTERIQELSKDTRQKMADMHQRAADCLKSDKSFAECQKEMMANCPMMKNGHCPMMEHGRGMHRGMMRGHAKNEDWGCCGNSPSEPTSEDDQRK